MVHQTFPREEKALGRLARDPGGQLRRRNVQANSHLGGFSSNRSAERSDKSGTLDSPGSGAAPYRNTRPGLDGIWNALWRPGLLRKPDGPQHGFDQFPDGSDLVGSDQAAVVLRADAAGPRRDTDKSRGRGHARQQ